MPIRRTTSRLVAPLAVMLLVALPVAPGAADQPGSSAAKAKTCATKAEFKQIKKDMSPKAVQQIVGGKPERSSTWGKDMKTTTWWACDFVNWISVDYKKDKVVAKFWNSCGTPRAEVEARC